jgi:hypothetical protein
MEYLRLDDQIFDRQISLRDAYRIIQTFVEQYNARGQSSTFHLMSDIGSSGGGTVQRPCPDQ